MGGSGQSIRFLILDPQDNVATLLEAGETGHLVAVPGGPGVTLAGPVPAGHKVALAPLAAGQPIVKYGVSIGRATQPIAPGAHVHIHNMESCRGKSALKEEDR